MSHPPYNIFSQHRHPTRALTRLRELIPNAIVATEPDGHWTKLTGIWKRGFLKGSLLLTVNHDPGYYAGENWPVQLNGMANYFRTFPGSEQRPDLFGYIPGLTFALSFILDPDPVENDPRIAVIFEMVQQLDGVIFLPTGLLDREGRPIVAADGEADPQAELPYHVPAFTDTEQTPEEEGEAESAAELPDECRVLTRFLVLTALMERGFLEKEQQHGPEAAEDYRAVMVQGLHDVGAWDECESWEAEALEAPLGTLEEKLCWKLPWLSEGAAVLAWALGEAELPSYDQQVDVQSLYDIRDALMTSDTLSPVRPLEELQTLSHQMLAVHWRLRQFQVEPKAMDFVEYAPRAWCGPMDLGLARLIDNDLEVNGVPLSEAPEEAWKCASSILEERRMAIHWLLGEAAVYSENDTST